MEEFEKIQRLSFLRKVGVSHEDFIAILLDVEEYAEKQLSIKPLRRRGKKPSISLPDKLLLCFFIYAITPLLLN